MPLQGRAGPMPRIDGEGQFATFILNPELGLLPMLPVPISYAPLCSRHPWKPGKTCDAFRQKAVGPRFDARQFCKEIQPLFYRQPD